MYAEMLQRSRLLAPEENLVDWMVRFDGMAASGWCAQCIKQHDPADLQRVHSVVSDGDIYCHCAPQRRNQLPRPWGLRLGWPPLAGL